MTTPGRADREDIRMAQERLRLRVRAQMARLSDREVLQVLGGEQQAYTPLAREIATAEINRRGGREAIGQRWAQEKAETVRRTRARKHPQPAAANRESGFCSFAQSFEQEEFVLKVFGGLLIMVLGATYVEALGILTVLSFCWNR